MRSNSAKSKILKKNPVQAAPIGALDRGVTRAPRPDRKNREKVAEAKPLRWVPSPNCPGRPGFTRQVRVCSDRMP